MFYAYSYIENYRLVYRNISSSIFRFDFSRHFGRKLQRNMKFLKSYSGLFYIITYKLPCSYHIGTRAPYLKYVNNELLFAYNTTRYKYELHLENIFFLPILEMEPKKIIIFLYYCCILSR